MMELLYNFELSSRHTKVQASALQTFADVLNVDQKQLNELIYICVLVTSCPEQDIKLYPNCVQLDKIKVFVPKVLKRISLALFLSSV